MVEIKLNGKTYKLYLENEDNNQWPKVVDENGDELGKQKGTQKILKKFLYASGMTKEECEAANLTNTHGYIKYVYSHVQDGSLASEQNVTTKVYYAVMQRVGRNGPYETETAGGYIEAPLSGQGGFVPGHYKRVSEVKVGDIIFSISDQYLKAISIALSDPYIQGNNRKVNVEYHILPNAVDLRNHKTTLKNLCATPAKNQPFNSKNGNGNQGYLFNTTDGLKDFLISKAMEQNPGFDFSFLDEIANEPDEEEDASMIDDEIKISLNMILYGPPGTGKTYNTRVLAVAACDGKASLENKTYADVVARFDELVRDGRITFTTFHQSYSYEDFIEGIKPETVGGNVSYPIKDGKFVEFCNNARGKENCVFIIDEINRGNISKIFGELITLIEPSKREGNSEAISAKLPYSNKDFSVPNNVYILGTMNTADRSIAIMDTALRRRFDYIEMMPSLKALQSAGVSTVDHDGKSLDVIEMVDVLNKRIERLMDREHTLGHAFFIGLTGANATLENLKDVFKNKVIPLLQEYFYEDYSKIALVLGDNNKSDERFKFIAEDKSPITSIFKAGGIDSSDFASRTFRINYEALKHIESYIEIK